MSDSCDPMDRGAWQATVHGILQARILEWVAISFSRDLPNPGIEPGSPALQADSLPTDLQWKPSPALIVCRLFDDLTDVVNCSLVPLPFLFPA